MPVRDKQTKIDFIKIQQDLMTSLRGRQSKSGFALKLNRNVSQVARWESGETEIGFQDFVAVLESRKISFFAIVSDLARRPVVDLKDLLQYCADHQVEETGHMQVSLQTLNRWKSGETDPRLSDVLKLVHYSTNFLWGILGAISKRYPIAEAEKMIQYEQLDRDLQFAEPWTAVLLRTLELESYTRLKSHDSGLLARLTGLPCERVDALLDQLLRTGTIEVKENKYIACSKYTNTFGLDQKLQSFQLKQFWLKEIEKKYAHEIARFERNPADEPQSRISYSIFACNQEIKAQIDEKILNCYSEILKLLQSDRNNEENSVVGIVTLMSCNLAPQTESEKLANSK